MAEKNYGKLYLEAIKRAKDYRDGKNPEALKTAQAAVEFIFPELKEDDETIRRRLVYFISNWKKMCNNDLCGEPLWTSYERECDLMLDWLEKHQDADTK